jgi:HPr kinase/phosphorylase
MSCVVVTKGIRPRPLLRKLCEERGIPLLVTKRLTSAIIEGLTAFLEESLAPRVTLHGVLVEVGGLGTLLFGESGIGKSECALALIQRGHRLIADDLVVVQRFPNDVLLGSSSTHPAPHDSRTGRQLLGVTAVLETHDRLRHPPRTGSRAGSRSLRLDDETENILGVAILIRCPSRTGGTSPCCGSA